MHVAISFLYQNRPSVRFGAKPAVNHLPLNSIREACPHLGDPKVVYHFCYNSFNPARIWACVLSVETERNALSARSVRICFVSNVNFVRCLVPKSASTLPVLIASLYIIKVCQLVYQRVENWMLHVIVLCVYISEL